MKRLIIPGLTTKWKYPRPPLRVASKTNTAMKMILRFNVYRPMAHKSGTPEIVEKSQNVLVQFESGRRPSMGWVHTTNLSRRCRERSRTAAWKSSGSNHI